MKKLWRFLQYKLFWQVSGKNGLEKWISKRTDILSYKLLIYKNIYIFEKIAKCLFVCKQQIKCYCIIGHKKRLSEIITRLGLKWNISHQENWMGGQKGGAFEKKGLIVKTNADLFITTVKIFAVFMLCLWPTKIFLQ